MWSQRPALFSPHLVYLPVTFAWVSVQAAISITSSPEWLENVAEPHVAPGLPLATLCTVNTQILVSLSVLVPVCVEVSPCACPLGGPAPLLSSGEVSTTERLLYPEARLFFLPNGIS